MITENLSFRYKARYFKSGEITPATKNLLVVLHGYGQLAKYFLRKFEAVADDKTIIIAPEGLHHFYLEDVTSRSRTKNNRVGATWMTSENRLMDIDNYLAYLNTILEMELAGKKIPLTVLGFSQGAATATRWVLQGTIDFKKLILWAGIFPPDMNFESGHEILKNRSVYHVLGDKDPFANEERIAEMDALCNRLSITPIRINFAGSHEIDNAVLADVLEAS